RALHPDAALDLPLGHCQPCGGGECRAGASKPRIRRGGCPRRPRREFHAGLRSDLGRVREAMPGNSSGRLADVAPAFAAALSDAVKTAPLHDEAAIRRETVQVAMRDGIRLATDLYIPPATPAPVIAMRTPYGRRKHDPSLMA